MNPSIQSHYLLPESVPTALVCVMAAVALAAWVAGHLMKRRVPPDLWPQAVAFGVRLAIGVVAMLAAAQVMQRFLVLATNWPIWPIALVGALAVEIVVWLYALERRTVSRRVGGALAALRVAIIVLVIVMLTQPVWRWELNRTIQRFVAVLLDTSASMYIPDTQLGPSEKIRMASGLSARSVERPYALEGTAENLDKVRSELAAQGDWLAALASVDADGRRRQLADRREAMQAAFVAADKKAADAADAVAKPLGGSLKLDPAVTASLQDARQAITAQIRPRLKEAVTFTNSENAANLERDRERLLQSIRQAATSMADAAEKVATANDGIDQAVYASLPADQQARIDALAGKKRLEIARDVLAKSGASETDGKAAPLKGMNLLEKLQKRPYSLKMWTFAATPVEVNIREFVESMKSGGEPLGDGSSLPPQQQMTDLAAAFDKAMTDMSGKQLSGVLLLSDGRDTSSKSIDPLVRRLAAQQVPVSVVVFGGEKPPMDAGIISVDAPETVAVRDKMFANVEVKLDGLKGKDVRVAMTDQDKPVDTQVIHVPADSYRTRVQLADEPGRMGLHHYAIDVQKFDGEVLSSNNKFPLSVMVGDDRTKLLIIEGRPSWEFRYIKNLFSGRDRTVHLQYVLLEPDRIEGIPPLPKIEASASRPFDEIEATALPKDEAEWMKFDTILLGDVAPKFLSPEQLKILRRFVTDRGGALIVVSGPSHMPHAYADTPLADLLPVTFKKAEDSRETLTQQAAQAVAVGQQFTLPMPEPYVPSPEKSFRIALTADGRDSVILRQKTSPLENQEVWDSLPDFYWRHPIIKTKEAATVLAYALPPGAPAFLKQGPTPTAATAPAPPAPAQPQGRPGEARADETPSSDLQRERRAYEREHALIAYHNMALGKVMFLGTDHTWRLRYRVGDTYHHRLWGQILRWATANKLPVGTETVKIGTDHTRYPPHSTVRIQAKVAKKDYTPIISNDIAVNVYEGDVLKLHKKLVYAENSAGMYAADLGEFPSGTFRVELDAPPAKATLAEEGVDNIRCEFSVDPATAIEQAELMPDRSFLKRLTAQTGGLLVEPSKAERVIETLGPPSETQKDFREFVLWNSWPLLMVMLILATAEWLLRKKVGLA